ncbi:MAG TPA: hypothetical protein VHE56_05640 [Mycobacteriales bacterium]|nr:hypothetical protein [Mycobacteriales bacterium]
MVFRARLTRVARGILCAAIAVGLGWALYAESVFYGIDTTLRAAAMTITGIVELSLLVGLWRLWAVCLIVTEDGVIARNFRGDTRLRRGDIRGAFPLLEFASARVVLRLKTGDDLYLDGLVFATPGRANRAVADVSQALGRAPLEAES